MLHEKRPELGCDGGVRHPGEVLECLLQAQSDGSPSTVGANGIKPQLHQPIVDAGGGRPRGVRQSEVEVEDGGARGRRIGNQRMSRRILVQKGRRFGVRGLFPDGLLFCCGPGWVLAPGNSRQTPGIPCPSAGITSETETLRLGRDRALWKEVVRLAHSEIVAPGSGPIYVSRDGPANL